jgi:hypothetical protein
MYRQILLQAKKTNQASFDYTSVSLVAAQQLVMIIALQQYPHDNITDGKATSSTNLPRRETRSAKKVTTGLNSNVFIILGTNFAQLEGRAHFTVQFILLLSHTYMILRCILNQEAQVCIDSTLAIWIQVTVFQRKR